MKTQSHMALSRARDLLNSLLLFSLFHSDVWVIQRNSVAVWISISVELLCFTVLSFESRGFEVLTHTPADTLAHSS